MARAILRGHSITALAVAALLLLSGCERFMESEGIGAEPPPTAQSEAGETLGPSPQPKTAQPSDAGPPAADSPKAVDSEPRYEIFPGRGAAVGRPRKSLALVKEEAGGDITLNFADADIREVLKATMGGILGANYTVAPEVQAVISVQTERPISREALLPTLENVFRLHGLAIVNDGSLYRIAPLQGATRGNASVRLGLSAARPGDAYGIQIVPLYYVGAAQMAANLRPLGREGAVLNVDEGRNVLILGGTRRELASLLEAVEIFDVNWLAGMSFGLFKLEFAEAGALAEELRAILSDGRGSIADGLVRLVPVERLNAVLAVSRQSRYVTEVQRWVERLDRAGRSGVGGADRQLFIYFVQNGKAVDLAKVLSEVFAREPRAGGTRATPPGTLAPGLKGVVIESDPPPAGTQPAKQPVPPGAAPAAATDAPVRLAQPAPAQPTGAPGISLSGDGQLRVVADEERNALLISGSANEYRAVLSALKKLDRRPLEVLVEVTIADVTLSDRLEYGVRWFFQEGNHSVTLSDLSSGAVASTFPGLSYVYEVTNAKSVLDLLSAVTDVEVISAPQLLVLNNHKAELQVGDQVPVATQQSVSSTDPDAPIVSAIELRDTGVILRVTPRVSEGGLVIMDIEQEVSQVNLDADTGSITPTISKRVITTTVAVESGRTVALGGLIRDAKTNTKVGVPVLSAIPILGALFRYTTDTITRNELLVLVTPTIIRDEREALEATQELRRRMKDLERLEGKLDPKPEAGTADQ